MTSFTHLEKIGMMLITFVLLGIARFIVYAVYNHIIGPVINKVDFKSKGKWACEYL